MKQLLTLRFQSPQGSIDELDPRAIKFTAEYRRKSDLTRHDVEFEWCNPNQVDSLNMNNGSNLDKFLCIKDPS